MASTKNSVQKFYREERILISAVIAARERRCGDSWESEDKHWYQTMTPDLPAGRQAPDSLLYMVFFLQGINQPYSGIQWFTVKFFDPQAKVISPVFECMEIVADYLFISIK